MARKPDSEVLKHIFSQLKSGPYQPTPAEANVLIRFEQLEQEVRGSLHPKMFKDLALTAIEIRKVNRYEELNAALPVPRPVEVTFEPESRPTYNHVQSYSGLDDMLQGFYTYRVQ